MFVIYHELFLKIRIEPWMSVLRPLLENQGRAYRLQMWCTSNRHRECSPNVYTVDCPADDQVSVQIVPEKFGTYSSIPE